MDDCNTLRGRLLVAACLLSLTGILPGLFIGLVDAFPDRLLASAAFAVLALAVRVKLCGLPRWMVDFLCGGDAFQEDGVLHG